MSASRPHPRDQAARAAALVERQRGLLVEAGAGSGKTAILAGRVALLLADGVAARNIAAITFTELAAAELAARVSEYVDELLGGRVPATLSAGLPRGGLSAQQHLTLADARLTLDELTCTTIHGFAQELARPYPVELNVDPGASVLDPKDQQRLHKNALELWLTSLLDETGTLGAPGPGGLSAEGAFAHLVALGGISYEDLAGLAELLVADPRLAAPRSSGELTAVASEVVRHADEFHQAVASTPGAGEVAGTVASLIGEFVGPIRAMTGSLEDALAVLTRAYEPPLFTLGRSVRKLALKLKWRSAARAHGVSANEADSVYDSAARSHQQFAESVDELRAAAVDALLAAAARALGGANELYREAKRASAALDFGDLISNALTLLREHPAVRDELAERYQHVLVDEFQDTDPHQAEIVWRLTGVPTGGDWRSWHTHSGSRFLVGDPKQSIYRFRGADALTYALLAASMSADSGAKTLTLNTNFRSSENLIGTVNAVFADPLSGEAQPGYQPLHAWVKDPAPAVQFLPVTQGGQLGEGKRPPIGELRQAEAEAVANAVAQLVRGESSEVGEPVALSEIALLAPSGSGLDVYERALEARGLNVASQAGKGFYRRQEVQDLVALTRALADPEDTVALGALLTGPLVGATLEELLDITELLHAGGGPASYLSILTELALLPAGPARSALKRIQPLALRRFATTPYALLSEAVDALGVRATLTHRHRGRSSRALRNLERFLDSSRGYAVPGLQAFAQDANEAWKEKESELEGHADSSEDAVTLITVHSAKGLEWRVVVPVNMVSQVPRVRGILHDRQSGTVAAKLFGFPSSAYGELVARERTELHAERVRLWYVAATRAKELLLLPRHPSPSGGNTWEEVVAFPTDLPEVALTQPLEPAAAAAPVDASQTRPEFLREEERIKANLAVLERRAPSRQDEATIGELGAEESAPGITMTEEAVGELLAGLEEPGGELGASTTLHVGAVRGVLLHKLLEEVVNAECEANAASLRGRAAALLAQLQAPAGAVDPEEVAELALAAWLLPEVAALHGRLRAEVDVAGVERDALGRVSKVWAGVADAIAVDVAGQPEVVVDWKSDRAVSPATLEHYRQQLRAYLRLTEAREGLLVLASLNRTERVTLP